MTSSTEPMETIHVHCVHMREIAFRLQELSVAARMLGMQKLCDELRDHSVDLKNAASEISLAQDRAVNQRLRESEQATMNMVGAALASITLANHDPNAKDSPSRQP